MNRGEMHLPIDRARRWVQEAGDAIYDLPDPINSHVDRLGTIVYQLQQAVSALLEIEEKRAAEVSK